jgi:3-hydroxyacyl-[acyl-carrier-protein] dehydratase
MPISTLDPVAVLGLLAHRYPLLLVDRIDVLEPGRRVVGVKRVTSGEWAAGGAALGGWPVPVPGMPGTLVVEALAQTSAALLMGLVEGASEMLGYFAGMQRVRLRAPALPGDTLRLVVELRSFRRSIAKLYGIADVDGRTVASAGFTVIVRARAA